MKVGVVSDIHSNLVALEAVLADMPDVDRLVCAGDVVGYNAWPAECVDVLRERNVPTVMGNHDRMVATGRNFRGNGMAQAGVEYADAELNDVQRTWVENLPRERTFADGRLKVVHDHPEDQDRYTYPDEFSPALLGDEDALVLGHTHVQHHERYDEGVVVNPGSVGQPGTATPGRRTRCWTSRTCPSRSAASSTTSSASPTRFGGGAAVADSRATGERAVSHA